MGGKASLDKGKRAEREVVEILQAVVTKVYNELGYEAPLLQRNLMQAHKGGHDIAGLEWMSVEVKHHETLQVSQWWAQTCRQAGSSRCPILLYRKSRVAFRCMTRVCVNWGQDENEGGCQMDVDITLPQFLIYFEGLLRWHIQYNAIAPSLTKLE